MDHLSRFSLYIRTRSGAVLSWVDIVKPHFALLRQNARHPGSPIFNRYRRVRYGGLSDTVGPCGNHTAQGWVTYGNSKPGRCGFYRDDLYFPVDETVRTRTYGPFQPYDAHKMV